MVAKCTKRIKEKISEQDMWVDGAFASEEDMKTELNFSETLVLRSSIQLIYHDIYHKITFHLNPLASQNFGWLLFGIYSTHDCTNNVLFYWGTASKLSRLSVQSTKAGSGDLLNQKPKTENTITGPIHVTRPP